MIEGARLHAYSGDARTKCMVRPGYDPGLATLFKEKSLPVLSAPSIMQWVGMGRLLNVGQSRRGVLSAWQ